MLDHVTIGVSDLERSKAFYDKALKRRSASNVCLQKAQNFRIQSP
jgi:catechol 2,3-dioxygenase-like lactoylglutathione lyase family enzyme